MAKGLLRLQNGIIMLKGPLFFKTVFQEDDSYHTYSVVVSDDLENYTLLENGIFVMNFKELPLAIAYFEDEFNC